MAYTIKIIYLKNLGFFLAEAFSGGKQIAFSEGLTKKEAKRKLKKKLENYYHLPKQSYGKQGLDKASP